MQQLKLPSLGADMDDGTLIEWKVKTGDKVKRGDIVAVVDTTKAAIEVESWLEGTVEQLLVQPGDKFAVGTVMALLSGGDDKTAPAAETSERKRISPAARKRIAELGLDPAAVAGTGPQGSISLRDLEASTVGGSAPRDRSSAMRGTIAAAMARSKREIPHYYLGERIVMAKALSWLQAWNAERSVTDRVLPAALLLKAVARALRKYPQLNGVYTDGKFTPAADIHIGVAIALRSGGLIAPALLAVDQRPLGELMQGLNDLVQRARTGSLRSSELSSATITVTNLGELGVDQVFGVIYPPQVALVGFGGIHEQAMPDQGVVKILPTVHASLAADHRVSDGQVGARFLAHLSALLQNPATLATGEPV